MWSDADTHAAQAVAVADVVHRAVVEAHDDVAPGAEHLRMLVRAADPLAPAEVVQATVRRVQASVEGLGPLDSLLADPAVSEFMVNGPDSVWVERHGRLERVPMLIDAGTIAGLIERVVSPLGLRIDRASPLVDARLPDGSRVNAVVPPLAVDGPCLTIRRFGARSIPLPALAAGPVAALLAWAVAARCNIVVSGGTGAGKTTLLNALAEAIPPAERVVTIEDTAELRLSSPHVVRLEARPPNADGVGGVSVRSLVRNALRMRPDRIVVGECRAGEALDMLQAMNTGHEGSLSTCHTNGPLDALRRLETMVLMGDVALPHAAVRDQVTAAVDLVVHLERQPGGGRRVTEVAEVAAASGPGAAPDRLSVRCLAEAEAVVALPVRWRDRRGPAPDSRWLA